ncbi:MAG: ABC transporter substrate-binding protein [Anaerolineae bacterium]
MKLKATFAFLTVLALCTACCVDLPLLPTSVPTLTPSPTPEPKVLTVCMLDEPDSLYLYGTESVAAQHVWEAIYDGPLDSRTYAYQPVILAGLPSLAGGAGSPSAAIKTVTVQAGERVLSADGGVSVLASGMAVKDAEGRRVTFDGTPIQMQRMVVTFTLQSGLTWSDGTPLRADDSVFSFELAANPATPTDKTTVERTAGYYAVGDQTIIWVGVPGYLDHFYYLNFWHPLPRHAWGHLSASELLASDLSTRQPLGWGPFAIREWVPGERITLARNPAYFRAPGGLPRLDEVVFRFIPDPVVLSGELAAGRCDVVTHDAADAVRAALPDLPSQIQEISVHDARWELLAFGISPNADYDRPDFFEDVRVRQGIARCIDRQAIAEQLVGSSGRVLNSYVPPEHPLYAGGALASWAYDPAAGQALLASAGWYDENGDGVREAHGIPGVADGTAFQVAYHTTDDPLRMQTAQFVQTYLGACGIQITLEMVASDTFFAPGPEGLLFGRRFDLAQFSWRATPAPLCDLFLSGQVPDAGRWDRPNVVGFLDDEYDTACLSALGARPGSEQYAAGQIEAQRIFSERLPVLPLFQRSKVTLARETVIGLAPNPTQASELWNIEQLDLRP